MDFEKDYFYGKSNYLNYELSASLKSYKDEIDFIKQNKIRGRVIDVGCAFGFFLKKVETRIKRIEKIVDYAKNNKRIY